LKPRLNFLTGFTDAIGQAITLLTVAEGENTVTAKITTPEGDIIDTVTVTGEFPVPTSVKIISPKTGDKFCVGSIVDIIVEVRDQFGQLMGGVTVCFSGPLISVPVFVPTGADGQAKIQLTLSSPPGSYAINACVTTPVGKIKIICTFITIMVDILVGDVSGNCEITAYDASLVLQYVVGLTDFSTAQQQAADVTGDGTITALDAALILQYTVGLITKFPAQGAPILNSKDDNQLLTKIISELENSSLSTEQKQVLEQLKRLLWQRVVPKQTVLLQNYPNPFNPDVWIPFQLAQDVPVTISIYNAKGKLIRILHLGSKNAGVYVTKDKAAYWDGKDSFGQPVASGVYFYTLQAGKFSSTRKMAIVK
jgi:hypothetical protein